MPKKGFKTITVPASLKKDLEDYAKAHGISSLPKAIEELVGAKRIRKRRRKEVHP